MFTSGVFLCKKVLLYYKYCYLCWKLTDMITVTVGEQKTQEKPFPKVMISDLGQIILAIEPSIGREDLLTGYLLKSNGYPIGENGFTKNWSREKFTDFNDPITIQNA